MASTLVIILGALASVTLIISALSVHRMRLLVFSLLTSALVAAQLIIGDKPIATALLCLLGIVRTSMLVLAEKKYRWMNHWGMMLVFLTVYNVVFLSTTDYATVQWFEFFPLIGSCIGTIAIFVTNMRVTKVMIMSAVLLWSTFYFFSGMYTQLIGETANFIANAIALGMLIKAHRAGIPEKDIVDIDDRLADALTGSISVVTGSIRAVTSQIPVITDTASNRLPRA